VAGEQCDDGNLSNGDNCLNSCQRARCGDGYLDKSEPNIEQCDDGNAEACGTCSSACTQKVTPAKPEGRIVAIEGRKIADGEKFYVSDGSRRVEFEFDKNGAQPLPLHRVAISDSYDASGVASQIRTAIKGAFPDFDVTSSGFVVDVIHAKATAVGNQPIEETVADATFIVYGMSGGATNDCLQGVGCKQDADCASGACTNGICE
jgi:cysteine-rich repeat protein